MVRNPPCLAGSDGRTQRGDAEVQGPETGSLALGRSVPQRHPVCNGIRTGERSYRIARHIETGLSWVSQPEWQDGIVVALPQVDKSANYLFREIVSSKAQPLTLYLGSDDGIRVWLNGQLVMEHEINRSCHRNQEVVAVNLKKGTNRLLLKVSNGNGPTAFYFSVDDLDPLSSMEESPAGL